MPKKLVKIILFKKIQKKWFPLNNIPKINERLQLKNKDNKVTY